MSKNKKIFIAGVVALVAVACLSRLWQWWPEHSYHALISQPGFTRDLQSLSPTTVAATASKYHLQYQEFQGPVISYSSSSKLPVPKLVQQLEAASGVIQPSAAMYLAATNPYTATVGWQRYFYFPLSDSGHTFIFYGRTL